MSHIYIACVPFPHHNILLQVRSSRNTHRTNRKSPDHTSMADLSPRGWLLGMSQNKQIHGLFCGWAFS